MTCRKHEATVVAEIRLRQDERAMRDLYIFDIYLSVGTSLNGINENEGLRRRV
jgi:hypothetical protein